MNEYIPYSIFIDGVSLSLGSEGSSTQGHESSMYGSSVHGTRVMIGDVTDKIAGRYTDFVTITATAN